jgi:hypothetical protein
MRTISSEKILPDRSFAVDSTYEEMLRDRNASAQRPRETPLAKDSQSAYVKFGA